MTTFDVKLTSKETEEALFAEGLMLRIRHCVECPKCFTRYLISLSPYRNGAYVLATSRGCGDEYILFCSCKKGGAATPWKWSEVMTCRVTKEAFERGFRPAAEIMRVRGEDKESWTFKAAQYLHDWRSLDSRKNSQ